MRLVSLLNIATVICSGILAVPALAQTSIAEQQDAQIVEGLRQAGADITRPHAIDFFLIFKRESDAAAAGKEVRALGYDIHAIAQSPGAEGWEVHAKRKMVPAVTAMQATTRQLQALAAAWDGYYDGWGTAAVK